MKTTSLGFISLALLALLMGAFFGILAGLQYIFPEFLKEVVAFDKMRPFHVSTVVGWLILCAIGGIYYYLTFTLKLKISSSKIARIHFLLFGLCALFIYVSLALNKMGGREYLEYYPLISIPILIGWILFAINYFKSTYKQVKQWPVYLWMWGTGIVFMIFHFSEAHFWLIPYFRENYIKDLTVQWKSYGSFIGSWNMLIYGTSIFLMAQTKGTDDLARGRKVYFFYFLGLINLMLGWAHHSYIVPMQDWIRYLAYAVNMLEWIILFNIIWEWKNSIPGVQENKFYFTRKFLISTDFWIVINLFIALLISIPAVNYYTHGTHITVLHSMGTTIGINTSILLASVFFICTKENNQILSRKHGFINIGFWVMNISLFIFLASLLSSGIIRSVWMYSNETNITFGQMHDATKPFMIIFLLSGLGIFSGFLMIVSPVLRPVFIASLMQKKPEVL